MTTTLPGGDAATTVNVDELLAELEGSGVHLWVDAAELRYRAPRGALSDDRRGLLRHHRDVLIAALRHRSGAAATTAEPPKDGRDPFPLTDVQSAYLLGRRQTFALGRVGCHGYAELRSDDLDPARLQQAWRALIRRHEMLRAVFEATGSQRILDSVPDYDIRVVDARGAPDEGAAAVEAAREEMSHRLYDPSSWPLFELRVTRRDRDALLHLSFDLLIADLVSLQLLLDELRRLYADPGCQLPPIDLRFGDYVAEERRLRSGDRYDRDRTWWQQRLDDFPPAPRLPVLDGASRQAAPRFRRWRTVLEPAAWTSLAAEARRCGVTPTVALLAAYVEVLRRWSRSRRFAVDVTLMNRLPIHEHVGRVVGDFTSVDLLAVDHDSSSSLAGRARALQARLWEDLDHRLYSGVEVVREIGRRRGAEDALYPVVFTSAIGAGPARAGAGDGWDLSGAVHGITQTPQVWLDCQAMESGGTVVLTWDVRDGVFPDGLVDDMFTAFAGLVRLLAAEPEAWQRRALVALPPAQAQRRARANDTAAPLADALLHEGLLEQARRTPAAVAVVSGGRRLTYAEVVGRGTAVARTLGERGCRPGDIVAVAMEKGWEQVVAVLGVLLAGAAYLPVDTAQPALRRDGILRDAGVRHILSRRPGLDTVPPGGGEIFVDEVPADPAPGGPHARRATPDDLAYVVYTSGSTGAPKGVMVTHRAAWNTVEDVNRRFGVGPGDRVLGVASLSFDLSVYDLFGPLAVGGTLVLPDTGARVDPSRWAGLMVEHGVTVWNSVPAQMQMLCDYLHRAGRRPGAAAAPPLRLVMLSGDWIPLDLPEEILTVMPGARVVSLGGATEAAIWSIHHPVDRLRPDWRSIPYGRPLTNQTFHVLDDDFADCPDWVAGELYIGGAGLALGYLGDEERTRQRFLHHPGTGARLYRTGDLGRYRPDGEIEFLGREDAQVKIRGYRVELGEVEAAFQSHPGVRRAVALADGDGSLDRRLVAVVEPSGPDGAARDPDALLAHAAERLPAYMLPARVIVAGPLPLTANGKVDRRALAALAGDDGRAATGSDPGGDEPRDELEQRLAEAWATALRLEAVSRTTDFFDAGGDSLLAGKVVGELMDTVPEAAGMLFDELLVHVLEQRTVAALADRLCRGADHSGDRHGDEPASEVVDFGGPGGGPAFVMVHDATGGIDAALGLARALAAHRRTIAVVRAGGGPGAAGDERDGTGIDTLAAAHTRAVTAHGREGPLQVVGYGTGAPLALELARQLGEAGCAVERLCVVDGALPPAGDDPSPFVGDVTLVGRACPEGDGPAWWRDHCLGDVAVVELDDDVAGSLVGDGAGRVVRALCLAPGGA